MNLSYLLSFYVYISLVIVQCARSMEVGVANPLYNGDTSMMALQRWNDEILLCYIAKLPSHRFDRWQLTSYRMITQYQNKQGWFKEKIMYLKGIFFLIYIVMRMKYVCLKMLGFLRSVYDMMTWKLEMSHCFRNLLGTPKLYSVMKVIGWRYNLLNI